MIRVGVIGIGNMGQHHARHYSNFPNVKLVAVADADKKRLAVAKKYGCKFYADYRKMLKEEKLDCVSVAVPTALHAKVAIDALNNGAHVLVEKPISYDLNSANKIMKTARKNGLKLMVGHIERFNPVIKRTKELIDNKEVGDILSLDAKRLAIYHPRIRDCGIIIDLGIHDIDLMNFILNQEVKRVYAVANHRFVPNPRFEDYANVLLTFKNGVIGRIELSWISPRKARELSISGTKNYCKVDLIQQRIEMTDSFLETKEHLTWKDYQEFIKKFTPRIRILQESNVEPLFIELKEFIAAIEKDKPVPISGKDAIKALKIALLAIKSYRENKIIRVD